MTIFSINLSPSSLESTHFPINDFGFLYGYGIFETTAIVNGKPLLLKEHIQRLSKSAIILDLIFPYSFDDINNHIHQLLTDHDLKEGVLNLYFTAGERDFSKSQIQFDKPSFIVFVRPPRPLISSEGIFLALKQESFQRTPLDGLKTMAYLKNIYEKKLADPCDDVLLYDNNQSVLETSQSNVFFVKGNELLTPKSNCLLAGIMRQFIIDHQADLSINVHQQPIHIDELSSFDEIFLTNSVQQIQLVRSVKHYPELRSNHFSRLIQQKVMERLQDGS